MKLKNKEAGLEREEETALQPQPQPQRVHCREERSSEGGSSSGGEKPPPKKAVVVLSGSGRLKPHRRPRAAHDRGPPDPNAQYGVSGVQHSLADRTT